MGKEKKTTYRRSPGDGGPVQALKKKNKTKQTNQQQNSSNKKQTITLNFRHS